MGSRLPHDRLSRAQENRALGLRVEGFRVRGNNQGRKSTPLIALNLYSPDRTKKQTRTRIRATQGGRKGGRNPHPYQTLRTQALLFELVAFCSSPS